MNRVGCASCGDVLEAAHDQDFVLCGCGAVGLRAGHGSHFGSSLPPVDLPTAADKLVFKLRFAGRHDEAAIVQEHKPEHNERTANATHR